MTILLDFLKKLSTLFPIIKAIQQAGGNSYLVGGSVRDLIMNRPIKDIDIEVHNISLEDLQKTLQKFGPTELVGKQFGVLKIHPINADWSLPRTDSSGRKPTVIIDPTMTIEQACRRRDLTMNAMAIDLNQLMKAHANIEEQIAKNMSVADTSVTRASATNTSVTRASITDTPISIENIIPIIDPYGGLDDIRSHTLRAVDTKLFTQDPLRFYRVMQFIGRFGMYPNEELHALCSSMMLKDPITHTPVAQERIYEELKKLFLQSKRPSLGFRWLRDISRLHDTFPEVYALIGVEQRSDYHPEGDVFEHTMQSLDAAAQLYPFIKKAHETFDIHNNKQEKALHEEKWLLMLAVLCHDLGKPLVTEKISPTLIRSWEHEKAGVPIAKTLLKRITNNTFLIKAIQKLVRYHMMPGVLLQQKAGPAAYKRLAHKLAPEVSLWQLGLVALCDLRGRNPEHNSPLAFPQGTIKKKSIFDRFITKAKQAQVEHRPEEPILRGRDLLDSMQPGPEMGKILNEAYRLQIEEGIRDKEELKNRVVKKKEIT